MAAASLLLPLRAAAGVAASPLEGADELSNAPVLLRKLLLSGCGSSCCCCFPAGSTASCGLRAPPRCAGRNCGHNDGGRRGEPRGWVCSPRAWVAHPPRPAPMAKPSPMPRHASVSHPTPPLVVSSLATTSSGQPTVCKHDVDVLLPPPLPQPTCTSSADTPLLRAAGGSSSASAPAGRPQARQEAWLPITHYRLRAGRTPLLAHEGLSSVVCRREAQGVPPAAPTQRRRPHALTVRVSRSEAAPFAACATLLLTTPLCANSVGAPPAALPSSFLHAPTRHSRRRAEEGRAFAPAGALLQRLQPRLKRDGVGERFRWTAYAKKKVAGANAPPPVSTVQALSVVRRATSLPGAPCSHAV